MVKPILYEQLPPELVSLINEMKEEITRLRQILEEVTDNMISEAEFTAVKQRVADAEAKLETIEQTLADLEARLENTESNSQVITDLQNTVNLLSSSISALKSYDTSNTKAINAINNRIESIEQKHLVASLNQLEIPHTIEDDIILPTSDEYGVVITWESSHPLILSTTGVVNRPTAEQGDQTVTLRATLTYNESTTIKEFHIVVVALPPVEEPDPQPEEPVFDEAQFIYDINVTEGEGNLAELLLQLGIREYEDLPIPQQVEVAKLFAVQNPTTVVDETKTKGFTSIEEIIQKLEEALLLYQTFLDGINHATTIEEMTIALDNIGVLFGIPISDTMAQVALDGKVDANYESIAEVIALLTMPTEPSEEEPTNPEDSEPVDNPDSPEEQPEGDDQVEPTP